MKPERWQEAKEILYEALERDLGQRGDFLDLACKGDDELRREVESLLQAHEKAASFFERPLSDVAAELVTKQLSGALVGQVLGRYRVLSILGSGGMGDVYLAEDVLLHRKVALKLLPAYLTQDENRLRRFQQEARAASALNHPNVITIHEIGQVEGAFFITTEFIDGETLRVRINRGESSLVEQLEVAVQVATALAAAHDARIVHRDIKPENIMIRADGYVKVLDFGIAKLTEQSRTEAEAPTLIQTDTGVVMGTAYYMSPEQARGLPVDARTDLWSLGVVIYEMVAGRPPFKEETTTDTIISVLQKDPASLTRYAPETPAELERIVHKCLEKAPAQRYQSATQLLTDLKKLERGIASGAMTVVVTGRNKFSLTKSPRVLKMSLVAAIAILTMALAYLLLIRNGSKTFTSKGSDIKSLAVLPLENLSGDPNQEYFADGMTEALIANLAKISSLRVISRTSVMQYKGVHKPLPEIARELNVDGIIEGSVQRLGEGARITVQLIHGPTDRHLWSQTYERDMRNVLALQSEVAQAITGEIKVTLTPQELSHLAKSSQVNPEAYDYYLRGKFYFNHYTEEDSKRGIEMLERAVALDPGSAEGHAALALAYQYQFNNFTPAAKDLQEKTFVEAEKALGLDPDLADAYIARGRMIWIHANRFPHEDAIRDYRHALSLNPNSDEAFLQLGQVYGHIGLFDKAFQELQKAIAINPANVRARWFIGQTFLYQGKYEEALAASHGLSRELNPHMTGYQTAWALFELGRKEEALATLEDFLKDFPEDTPGTLASMQAIIFATAGEKAKAEEKIKVAAGKERDSIQFHHTAYNIGVAYALMNKVEEATKWLESSADDGFPCYPLYESDPNLNNIRRDRRFIELITKLRNQWEHYRLTL